MSEVSKQFGTLAFPISVLRAAAFQDRQQRWNAARYLGWYKLGEWLHSKQPQNAERFLNEFLTKHPKSAVKVNENLSVNHRHFAVGMHATNYWFKDLIFKPKWIDELLGDHNFHPDGEPRQALVILPLFKLCEWIDSPGDERRRFAICAVRSIVGTKLMARVSVPMVAARFAGYPSPSKCPVAQLSRQEVRTLLDKMGTEVSRVYAGGRFTWMSTRLTLDELKAEVLARKKKSNSINLIKSNHNNRNPIESSAAGSNHNNKEQPQANHGATASQPQANHNNLAVQSGLKNLVLKVRREKSNKAEGEALNEKTQKPSIWECVAPEVKAEYDKAVE